MKTAKPHFPMITLGSITRFLKYHGLILTLAASVPVASGADIGKTYATPEDAVSALAEAARAEDFQALRIIFGPAAAEIENPDRVQATNEFQAFDNALKQMKRIVRESEAKCILEVGGDHWPFPVPIVRKDGRWFFDTEAGQAEILNRRIGKNELSTLQTVRAYVEAQREYASKDRDDDEVLEYAQKFGSTPGRKDGLYWPLELDGEISPLGPLAADARGEGYSRKHAAPDAGPQPFHGYLFKVLTRQGSHAPGGKYDYIINGNMIGGFALVAWPAEYGESGVMTFIVNQQGRVYQKDLGPKTGRLAPAMKAYDRDADWEPSRD